MMVEGDTVRDCLLLEIIDPATGCWIEMEQLWLTDLPALLAMLSIDNFEYNVEYDLDAGDIDLLAKTYGLEFRSVPLMGRMCVMKRNSFFPDRIHTGRELLLMLDQRKPMAAFVEQDPPADGVSHIPESYFDPHVEAGRFSKLVVSLESAAIGRTGRVLYSLPGEEWRMHSYVMLWRLAARVGWSPEYEAIEGYLLGYETDIDPFFAGFPSTSPLP